jgi:hypothetical protein
MGNVPASESHLVHGLQVASNLLLKGCAAASPHLAAPRRPNSHLLATGTCRAPKTTGTPPERRVLLFTNNDQPAVADPDGSSALKHRVQILREQGHHVELLGLVRPESPSARHRLESLLVSLSARKTHAPLDTRSRHSPTLAALRRRRRTEHSTLASATTASCRRRARRP